MSSRDNDVDRVVERFRSLGREMAAFQIETLEKKASRISEREAVIRGPSLNLEGIKTPQTGFTPHHSKAALRDDDDDTRISVFVNVYMTGVHESQNVYLYVPGLGTSYYGVSRIGSATSPIGFIDYQDVATPDCGRAAPQTYGYIKKFLTMRAWWSQYSTCYGADVTVVSAGPPPVYAYMSECFCQVTNYDSNVPIVVNGTLLDLGESTIISGIAHAPGYPGGNQSAYGGGTSITISSD